MKILSISCVAGTFVWALTFLSPFQVPWSFPIVWGICCGISFYAVAASSNLKRKRDELRCIEDEFSDALFILGERISDGKPGEEAILHTAKVMEGTRISKYFHEASKNLLSFRASLKDSLLNEEFGAFRDLKSEKIRASLLLLCRSVEKSHKMAGIAIIKLADHLKELRRIQERIRRKLYDITSMMRSVSLFFAPLIGGITVALSGVMEEILHSTREVSLMETSVPFEIFVLSIGIYLIMLALILTHFSTTIEDGGDTIQFMYRLGEILPVSVLTFSAVTILSRTIFSSLI
jgi:hypothetical protein